MTQKEINLLIKDLCARLPYEVKVEYKNEKFDIQHVSPMFYEVKLDNYETWTVGVEDVKPYLFPLSSMTEEQKKELFNLCNFYREEDWEGKITEVYGIEIASRPNPAYCYDNSFRMWGVNMKSIDWLNKNHFDYQGLIEKGLAIDCTNLNIY